MKNIIGLCGCGKPAKYSKFTNNKFESGSCNKHKRCLTYDELRTKSLNLENAERYFRDTLLRIMNTTALDYEYRTWAKASLDDVDKWDR